MTPFGGLSLLVSIVILIVTGVFTLIQKIVGVSSHIWRAPKPRPLLSAIIIGSLCSLYVTAYSQALSFAFTDPDNNFSRAYYSTLHECEPIPKQPTHDKKVVLRLDDVQANGWTDISIQMMDDARERNMPVVAGIIPYNLESDSRIVHFFKRYGCTVEVAIHGYKHGIGEEGARGIGEYARLSHDDALTLTRTAQKELWDVIETRAVSFIPPNNIMSQSAVEAVNFLGMPIISSIDKDAYGFDASTYPTTTKQIRAEDVMRDCDQRWAQNDPLCVIMLHPQDFSDEDHELDPDLYTVYTKLLELLDRRNDVEITTFRDLAQ